MAEYLLGVNYGHDAAVALLRDGEIVEVMQEERLSRLKKYRGFPHLALAYVREKYEVPHGAPVIAVNAKASSRIFATREDNERDRARKAPPDIFLRALAMRFPWIERLVFRPRAALLRLSSRIRARRLRPDRYLAEQCGSEPTYLEHHMGHAWSTVPFMPDHKPRLIFTLDGAGDGLSGSVSLFDGKTITRLHAFPERVSIGLMYSGITDILGMSRNEHEFKVMGLAPYAKPAHGELVYQKLASLLWFDADAMELRAAFPMYRAAEYFIAHNYELYRFDSLAYGVQKLTEELTQAIVRAAVAKYGVSDIAVAGGVFMNVKANQYLAAMPEVSSMVITPSGGDESLVIGAVAYGQAARHGTHTTPLRKIYLGSEYSDSEIKAAIDAYPQAGEWKIEHCEDGTIEGRVAELLAGNAVVGRFKGRAEWGARALGNRSILANPSSRDNVKLINEMIKGRDFWMPFAASILAERCDDYLVNPRGVSAPYMAVTFDTHERAHTELQAALHPYDQTSRPQMVTAEANPEYHTLISAFDRLTGIGGVLNTSFNLHGEPAVEMPEDALHTFARSGLPHLAIGNYLLSK